MPTPRSHKLEITIIRKVWLQIAVLTSLILIVYARTLAGIYAKVKYQPMKIIPMPF